MRRTSALIICIILLALPALAAPPPPPPTPGSPGGSSSGQTINIDISGFAFSPSSITISPGDTVVWTNKDSAPHTVTSTSGAELVSGTIAAGSTFSHTFNNAGTFGYKCEFHPSMTGSVTVGSSSTSGTQTSSASGSDGTTQEQLTATDDSSASGEEEYYYETSEDAGSTEQTQENQGYYDESYYAPEYEEPSDTQLAEENEQLKAQVSELEQDIASKLSTIEDLEEHVQVLESERGTPLWASALMALLAVSIVGMGAYIYKSRSMNSPAAGTPQQPTAPPAEIASAVQWARSERQHGKTPSAIRAEFQQQGWTPAQTDEIMKYV